LFVRDASITANTREHEIKKALRGVWQLPAQEANPQPAVCAPRGRRDTFAPEDIDMPYGLFVPDVPDATAYTLDGSESV
jgi:hypothetical protein